MTKLAHSSRRKFLIDSARQISVAAIAATGLAGYARLAKSSPASAIRPPGALAEDEFNAACIRCGLCVRDCPYPTLSLAELSSEVTTGTPYFTAREHPCEMCDDIPCVKACPTGALSHELTKIDDAKMGIAHIVDQEACIAFQGLRCEVCYNVCPVIGKAITIERQHNVRSQKHALFIPVVHSDGCTGCGKCEHACILTEAAIKVLPFNLAKGKMQAQYRLGWQEKRKNNNQALVTPDAKHEYYLPENQEYDYAGEGLIDKKQTKSSPFKRNPLDTLNNKGAL